MEYVDELIEKTKASGKNTSWKYWYDLKKEVIEWEKSKPTKEEIEYFNKNAHWEKVLMITDGKNPEE
jgi:hypothetical protein